MAIIGTAGHVDHGKSILVQALSGTGGRQEATRPLRSRVRGLQQYGRPVDEARPGP